MYALRILAIVGASMAVFLWLLVNVISTVTGLPIGG